MCSFCLFAGLLCAMCACGETHPRMYPIPTRSTSAPKPISQLVTPADTPTVSDDVGAPGSTTDQETDDKRRETDRHQDGLFASVRDARCILINDIPPNRLNEMGCRRHGLKLAGPISSDELYPSGVLAKPTTTERANAKCAPSIDAHIFKIAMIGGFKLRASPYRRRPNFFGATAKRHRLHIEDALMAAPDGEKSTLGSNKSPCRNRTASQRANVPTDE